MIARINVREPDHTLAHGTVFGWDTAGKNRVQLEGDDIVLDYEGLAIGVLDLAEAATLVEAIQSAIVHFGNRARR